MNDSEDPRKLGIGGAPTRATTLPTGAAERKQYPVASGVLDYFPDAIVAISNLSQRGNDQHNPGQPLHWAREKSGDESDTMLRHFLAWHYGYRRRTTHRENGVASLGDTAERNRSRTGS